MITKVRKIGNSVGILLPKAVLEQCSINDEVNLEVSDSSIIITPVEKKPREGWEEQFIKAGSLTDREMLIGEVANSFDDEEWTW